MKAHSKRTGLIRVAELVLNEQPIRLQQAMDAYASVATQVPKPTNATKFTNFLCRRLPVELFSAARKEGTWLMERADDKYVLIRRLTLARGSQANLASGLSVEGYRKLEGVLEPVERDFCRYLLAQIYGVREASERFRVTNLERIVEKITTVTDKATELTQKSKPATLKAARASLQNAPRGGRKRWEEASPKTLQVLRKNVLANVKTLLIPSLVL